MTDTHLPDVSEFQAGADLSKLPAVILRAHNGHREDRAYRQHRASSAKAVVRGHYLYLVAGVDAAEQGREFAAAVGRLGPGEFAVVDVEEGYGDQSPRAEAAASAIDEKLGGRALIYSGAAFWAAHLSGVSRSRWVASYGSREPRGPHLLWQHTDREKFPGKGLEAVDCSIFHGTLHDLRVAVDKSQGRHVAPAFATLRRGSHGDEVGHLQRDLARVYPGIDVGPSGHYLEPLAAAVARLRHDTAIAPGDIGPGDFDTAAAHKIGWNV